ncbi:MAG: hypothetical protein Q8N51_03405, partial [Gammaproteobacteria bacterium]|nr:hypothetical protein [Gammaproteobacteria bacterium]
KKTGVSAVDRLTIVAHDKFQEIVDEANRGDSIIRRIETIVLDADGAEDAPKPMAVPSVIEQILGGEAPVSIPALGPATPSTDSTPATPSAARPTFNTPNEKAVAKATLTAITKKTTLTSAAALLTPAEQKKIVEEVRAAVPQQQALPGIEMDLEAVVQRATEAYVALSIDIPAITVVPTGDVTITFDDFDLDTKVIPPLQAVEEDILIQHLQSNEQQELSVAGGGIQEASLDDYIVSALIGFDDVDYDAISDLLYKLAGQLVGHLKSYLGTEDKVRNVLIYYQGRLGELVHAQMNTRRREKVTGYEVKVLSGHRPLKPAMFAVRPSETPRNFRALVEDKRRITQMIFGGFNKCLYQLQKFDSDTERRLAVLLENDHDVTKWVKPAKGNFQISLKGGSMYEPDFVVEASHGRYLCEVKGANFVGQDDVLAKADAAATWCKNATQYATSDGLPWRYLLLPSDVVMDNRSLRVLANEYEYSTSVPSVTTVVATEGKVLPFRRVRGGEVKPFINCVPLYDIKVAAGRFSEEQVVDGVSQVGEVTSPDDYDWVTLQGRTKPARGLFVAQVVGESMNKRISNGAWCVWNLDHGCDGQGGSEIVLAQHRVISDDELGGHFTVKLYKREEHLGADGSVDGVTITLTPNSTDARFTPIVLKNLGDDELNIIAELVEVLR